MYDGYKTLVNSGVFYPFIMKSRKRGVNFGRQNIDE